MIAKIKVWGKEYPLSTISFRDERGEVLNVSFDDEVGDHHTVFNLASYEKENTDVEKGNLRMDLSKVITWEEINHESSIS